MLNIVYHIIRSLPGPQALDIARRSTLARIKKCCQIMGRGEDKLTAAQILYPIMQCTDIFFLKAKHMYMYMCIYVCVYIYLAYYTI